MTDGPQVRRRARALGVLVAGCVLLGACSTTPKPTTQAIADLRTEVQKTVKDPARATRALAGVDSMAALIPVIVEFQSRTANDLRPLLRNYDATREDFERALSGWETDRATVRGRVLAAHEAFKRALTDAEWKQLKGAERKIVFEYPVAQIEGADKAPEGGR